MIYPYKCSSCRHLFDVTKSMHDAAKDEVCPLCLNPGDRVFTRFYFSGAAPQEAEFNPGLGVVVKNKYDRAEICKRKNLIEIGNDYVSGESLQTVFDRDKEKRRADEWEKL